MAKISFDLRGTKMEVMRGVISTFLIFLSGLFMAVSFYVLSAVESAFNAMNCLIPDNVYVSTCQEWFELSIYPALQLRHILIWFSYFYIFGIVFGLFYLGFKTKKHPSLFAVHIILSIIFGYLAIEISNVYRTIIQNPLMFEILTPFAIYNKIMIYFPQFMFFIIFISGLIGFMGLIKGKFNEGIDEIK